ncbi:MAG: hypothetical protein A2289_06555 [Deltaproteobacteria bacterium RIFOXYA12_FULL_58_15]|nr:MAG: hypothetical protein A2289_06555 [Deltaproteobacteria bacterium RIFOXYA12_FULL_58_15]
MKLVVVIPTFNAGRFLDPVVRRVIGSAGHEDLAVRIIDDGSTDDTCMVARDLAAADSRVGVITRVHNGGYGAAVKDGLQAARELGADVVACVHADGQYAPEELSRLLFRLKDFDLVQGSRVASGTALLGGMPLYKYIANRALTGLGNRVLGAGLSDYFSGYLVYGSRALREIHFASLSQSFDFDLEVIACARAQKLRVGEIPIPTHYGDEVSHLRPWKYGLAVLRVMWRYQRGHYHVR